jgi:REP element-mobilizing transposase RayT
MGKRNRTLVTSPTLFFVTSSLKDWIPLFKKSSTRDRVQEQLFRLFPSKADALMGYVIMPTHVHLFVGCTKGGNQLSEFMRSFKSLTSRCIFPEYGSIWMHRFDDLVILSEKQFNIKLKYMHENPVRKGLVEEITDWEWSSAKFWHSDDTHPVLTKTWDWLSGGDT